MLSELKVQGTLQLDASKETADVIITDEIHSLAKEGFDPTKYYLYLVHAGEARIESANQNIIYFGEAHHLHAFLQMFTLLIRTLAEIQKKSEEKD